MPSDNLLQRFYVWGLCVFFRRASSKTVHLKFLTLILTAGLLTGCVSPLSQKDEAQLRQLQKEVESVIQAEWNYFWHEVEQEAKTRWDEFVRVSEQQLQEWWVQTVDEQITLLRSNFEEFQEEQWPRWQEWLGTSVPARVGVADTNVSTHLSSSYIQAAFVDTYRKAGGARSIGWPEDGVHLEHGYLVQHYAGGTEKRAVIIMQNVESSAYVISGAWLSMFEYLGGLTVAGIPQSNLDTTDSIWPLSLFWGGRKQIFSTNGQTYALMQAAGSGLVYMVPPKFWKIYTDQNGETVLGYPLSSNPLDEKIWETERNLSAEARSVLSIWQEQSTRIQIFEKGSIVILNNAKAEVIPKKVLQGKELNLDATLVSTFKVIPTLDGWSSCELSTFDAVQRASLSTVIRKTLDLVLKEVSGAVLDGVSIGTSSVLIERGSVIFSVLLDASDIEDSGDAWSFVARHFANSLFSKVVGDGLVSSFTWSVTEEPIKQGLESISSDISVAYTTYEVKDSPAFGEPIRKINLAVLYDPYTHMIMGVVKSDCAPKGYAFQYRINPESGRPLENTQGTWDGQIRVYDIQARKRVH